MCTWDQKVNSGIVKAWRVTQYKYWGHIKVKIKCQGPRALLDTPGPGLICLDV